MSIVSSNDGLMLFLIFQRNQVLSLGFITYALDVDYHSVAVHFNLGFTDYHYYI